MCTSKFNSHSELSRRRMQHDETLLLSLASSKIPLHYWNSFVSVIHCLSPRRPASDSPCAHLQRVYPQCDLGRQAKFTGCELTLLTCLLHERADSSIINPDASVRWILKNMSILNNGHSISVTCGERCAYSKTGTCMPVLCSGCLGTSGRRICPTEASVASQQTLLLWLHQLCHAQQLGVWGSWLRPSPLFSWRLSKEKMKTEKSLKAVNKFLPSLRVQLCNYIPHSTISANPRTMM